MLKSIVGSIPKKYLVVEVVFVAVCAVLCALYQYTPENIIFFGIATGLAMAHLFGQHNHPIWATIWSLLTIYLVGPIGVLGTATYWYLSFSKGNTSRSHSSTRGHGATPNRTALRRVYGIVPVLRIPIPWVIYELTDKTVIRSGWFSRRDPEPLKRIENWYISGDITRSLTGTSSFGFRSKKPHDDDYVVWKFLPASFAEDLSNALEELSST